MMLAAVVIVVAITRFSQPSYEVIAGYAHPDGGGNQGKNQGIEQAVHWGLFTTRDTLAQWIAATAAIFSFAASVWAIWLVRKTLEETRRAIHADNRPWLDFEIEPASDFCRNDTDYHPEGFGVDIKFIIINHGKSPAIEVLTSVDEVKISAETVIEDFSLDKYRERLLRQIGKYRSPRSTIFATSKAEIWNRIVVSREAVTDAIQRLSPVPSTPEFSLKTRYIVAVYYRSVTSNEVHETSTVVYLHTTYGRKHTTDLVFRKGGDFRPIPRSKIRLYSMEQKRAN